MEVSLTAGQVDDGSQRERESKAGHTTEKAQRVKRRTREASTGVEDAREDEMTIERP